jgi:hypothetical protein
MQQSAIFSHMVRRRRPQICPICTSVFATRSRSDSVFRGSGLGSLAERGSILAYGRKVSKAIRGMAGPYTTKQARIEEAAKQVVSQL